MHALFLRTINRIPLICNQKKWGDLRYKTRLTQGDFDPLYGLFFTSHIQSQNLFYQEKKMSFLLFRYR